jgi:hypothetical protein
MTPSTYAREGESWHDDRRGYLKVLEESWQKYQRDQSHLRRFTFDAAQASWVMLVQYAKLVGSRIGNPDLARDDDFWGRVDAGVASILKEAEATLRKLWESYLDWAGVSEDTLIPHWKELAQYHGFRFTKSGQDDVLELDEALIRSL